MNFSTLIDDGLDFAARCGTVANLQDLIDEFRACVRRYGFTGSVCGAWTGVGRGRTYRFFFNDWPRDWAEIYTSNNIFPDDPFVAEARRQMSLFLWTEMERKRQIGPRAKEIHRLAYEYGWREVVGIPIHGPNGYSGLVTLATREQLVLTPKQRVILSAMSLAIHHRCRTEADFGMAAADAPKLTNREVECLQWVAVGKTDWEIGHILGVAEATAHYHIERAKKKLGVTSRVNAVALLALRGII